VSEWRGIRSLPMPPSFRVGRRRLFLKQEVERWLAAQAGVSGSYDH